MLAYLSDGLRFLFREGSWSLKPHEETTVIAALAVLPDDQRTLATKQLGQRFFVERQSDGRIPCFRYYAENSLSRLTGNYSTGDQFISVKLQAGDRKTSGKLVLHDGLVFGLEFSKPSSFFRQVCVDVISASCDDGSFGYTAVIDRAEHGSDGNQT
ncbi:hypothetical protein [uncultured Roseibium sp.]|uniref:hypothetical protein n=1 Tax=uncultured Roseibium sp. TaxID=1936171 RepID=UPI002614B12C|nr:hypothetical protein [uncultured Roseibium sp.]